MSVHDFDEFVNWYTKQMNLEDIVLVLHKAMPQLGWDLSQWKHETLQQHLVEAWSTEEFREKISDALLSSCPKEIKSLGVISIDSLRPMANKLIEQYGLVSVVLSLVVCNDKDRVKIGFDLINIYEAEEAKKVLKDKGVLTKSNRKGLILVPRKKGSRKRNKSTKGKMPTAGQESNNGKKALEPVRVLQTVERCIAEKTSVASINVKEFDFALQKLIATWTVYKKSVVAAEQFNQEIISLLNEFNTQQRAEITYVQAIPFEVKGYRQVREKDYQLVLKSLRTLQPLAQEVFELRSFRAPSAVEQSGVWEKTSVVWDKIKENTDVLLSCLERERDTDTCDVKRVPPTKSKDRFLEEITPEESEEGGLAGPEAAQETVVEDELKSDAIEKIEQVTVIDETTDEENLIVPVSPTEKVARLKVLSESKELDENNRIYTSMNKAKQAFWKCLGRAQVAGAYWLAREIEDNADSSPKEGSISVFPSWLLLASFLSQYGTWKSSEEVECLFDIVVSHPQPCSELLPQLGISPRSLARYIATIALPVALRAPQTGAYSWLQDAVSQLGNPADELVQVLNAVIEFAARGEPLDCYHVQVNDALEWENKAVAAAENAVEWEKQVAGSRTSYAPANKVLARLVGPDSKIADALKIVKGNEYNRVDVIQAALKDWLVNRRAMSRLVEEETKGAYNNRAYVPRIDAKPLEQIIHKLQDLQSIFDDWVAAALVGKSLEQKGDWRYRIAMDLREQLIAYRQFFQENSSSWASVPVKNPTETETIEYTLGQVTRWWLCNFLDDMSGEKPGSEVPLNKGDWIRILRRPLLLLNDPPLEDDGMFDLETPFQPSEPLWTMVLGDHSWEDICSRHIENHNFLAADLTLVELEEEKSLSVNSLTEKRKLMFTEARYLLKERITDTYNRIEQATIDHVLSETSRSCISGQLLSIEESTTLKVYELFRELDQIILKLDQLRQNRLASLGELIHILKDDLKEENTDIKNYPAAVRYSELAEQAFSSGDLPLADEYLDYAERAVALGIDVGFEEESPTTSTVKEFKRLFNNLYHTLNNAEGRSANAIIDALERGESVAGLDMRRTTGARRREIRPAIEAWRNLKRPIVRNNERILKALICVLEYLGFQNPQARLIDKDKNSLHFSVSMVAGTLSPLPEFGSERNNHYDVVAIHGRPSAATIDQTLHQYSVVGNRPIVFYLGRITPMQHREWSEYCQSHSLTAMLVDEVLLYYLASQRESRLPAAISCGVAWGYAIPYRSFGVIPREIFKGRRQMVQELADPRGSCIVYGGRQLGKSVLLRMVEREFHRPEQSTYVYYDDIKPLGDPQGFLVPSAIWQRLREWLVADSLLPGDVASDSETIAQQIINTLKTNEKPRIVVLFDEADNFMAADAKANFEEVQRLKRIMDQTDRRFKVVFCGLHSVQRYCSLENHPFAQLGHPLVVGPLEPRAARTLIEQPMSALGFLFETKEHNDAVLKILCYTNYHPALIQLFCKELIEMVRNYQHEPPYEITPEDVEAVYRREDVRGVMRERFEWTVALDARYQAIVYAMIVEQTKERDGYRREFTTTEIHNLVKHWWPEGFASVPLEESQSLLEELVDLGVLVKRQGGTYRLRNGNVVRALGSEQEIFERLEEVIARPSPVVSEALHFRSWIDVEHGIRSPFTTKQAGFLKKAGHGIGLIFGSSALGLNHVPRTLGLMLDSKLGGNGKVALQKMPPHCSSSEQVCNYLRRLTQKRDRERTIVYCNAANLAIRPSDLPQVMQDATAVLDKYCRRNRSVRWLIVFDPISTERWVQLPEPLREKAETLPDALVILNLWEKEMVGKFLSDLDLFSPEPVVSAVMEATGSWPYLVEEFWQLLQENKKRGVLEPMSTATRLKQMFKNNIQQIRTHFIERTAIDNITHGRILLKVINDLQPIKWDEVPHLVEASGNIDLIHEPIESITGSICTLQRLSILHEGPQGLMVDSTVAEAVAFD